MENLYTYDGADELRSSYSYSAEMYLLWGFILINAIITWRYMCSYPFKALE